MERKTKIYMNKNVNALSSYTEIILPQSPKYIKKSDNRQISKKYFSIVNNAYKLYREGKLFEAKEEYLKVFNFKFKDYTYNNYLIRVYRKLIRNLHKDGNYKEALKISDEMLLRCKNYSIQDLKNHNKLVYILNKQDMGIAPILELKTYDYDLDIIDTTFSIKYITELKKKSYTRNSNGVSEIIPPQLPNVYFDKTKIIYHIENHKKIREVNHSIYRVKYSNDGKNFISCSNSLNIYIHDCFNKLLKKISAQKYSNNKYHLRCVDLSSNLSLFMFTNIDKAYILDSDFKLILVWETPYKEGFEKRYVGSTSGLSKGEYEKNLEILELSGNPTIDEIKRNFKKLILKHHPDKNPSDPNAKEKSMNLICAYEILTGEEVEGYFDDDSEYFWVDTSKIAIIEENGLKYEFIATLDDGEDWIYGTGISDDGERIYIGCYTGIIYHIDKKGKIIKKYIISKGRAANRYHPIRQIREYNYNLYILTSYYLYILKNDRLINILNVDFGRFSWFKKGMVFIKNKTLKIYNLSGILKCSFVFVENINGIFYSNNVLLVETKSKYISFLIK